MTRPTLSILVAAHHEGLIAHKTMLSIKRAVANLSTNDKLVTFEIIVTIDNGDEQTIEYFSQYSKDPEVTVYEINKGDLSSARNFAIEKSNGTFIATIDADDLVSENWFKEGLSMLMTASTPVILHTHYSVNFGTQDIVWEKFNSRSKEEDAIIMTWANRWDSAIIAPRVIFERFPYQPNTDGYGSEDWHFNSETLAEDIPHKVVKETVLFVRRKDISEMTIQAADRRTIHYTKLLSIDFLKTIDTTSYKVAPLTAIQPFPLRPQLHQIIHLGVKTVRFGHMKAKRLKTYRSLMQPLLESYKRHTQSDESHRFPKWLTNEWRAIHHIDKSIFPSRHLLKKIPLYHSEMYELGVVFQALMSSLSGEVDYIMFIPALRPGGAEVVMLNFLKALQAVKPSWKLAVVTTELNANDWRNRLPNGVDFIDFGNMASGFTKPLQEQLLARLIVQSKATRLHIAQSLLAYSFATLYQSFLKNYIIYSFAFCEDTDNEKRVAGHIHSGLPGAYPVITKTFTDHHEIINELVHEYSFDQSKFATLYQPVDLPIQPAHTPHTPLRILWASRIAKQKRPDILRAIAQKLDPATATIDVYGIFENDYDTHFFDDIEVLTYRGTFSDVRDLHAEKYDAFLYTSENDGIPNILLEMLANGLVVVAPRIGGIPELINHETGVLIDNNTDIDAYAKAIEDIAMNYSSYTKRLQSAQKLIEGRHSFAHLVSELKKHL